MKIELCNFSGQKIYPSKGKIYVRGDSKVSRLIGAACSDRDETEREGLRGIARL